MWNIEKNVGLVISETKETSDLYFSKYNLIWFEKYKRNIKGHCAVQKCVVSV